MSSPSSGREGRGGITIKGLLPKLFPEKPLIYDFEDALSYVSNKADHLYHSM